MMRRSRISYLENRTEDWESPVFHALVIDDRTGTIHVPIADTLDFQIYRPDHSLQWLENEGDFPFRHHHLMSLPGRVAATTVDLDRDGDLDIVTSTFLPFGSIDVVSHANAMDRVRIPSLAWLEQQFPGSFQTHVLENNRCAHASVVAADLDGDGSVELVTGHMTLEGITRRAINLGPNVGQLSVWSQGGAERARGAAAQETRRLPLDKVGGAPP